MVKVSSREPDPHDYIFEPRPQLPTLRPYPIKSKEDKVVKMMDKLSGGISFIKDVIGKVISTCTLPIKFVVSSFTRKAKEKQNITETVPVSFASCQKTAMDSKFTYAVIDDKVVYRPIGASKDAPWKPFGNHDGYADTAHTPIKAISADGDNVVVLDEHNRAHYAKSHSVNVEVDFDSPNWTELPGAKVIWTTKWFNMDIVSTGVNLIKDPTLIVPQNARSFAISHKGSDAMYYTDMAGKKHPDPFIGVTTLYVLDETGTRIFLADPWLHNKLENEITGPEDGRFVAENMAVSASTPFLIQRARDKDGKEIHKMYTRYADFDSIGSNPALPSTYDIDNKTPLVRFLPAEDWLLQPTIPLEGMARLTSDIAILQTGRGQDHRQLRVTGTDKDGNSGYYFKDIYDQEWQFEQTGQAIPQEAFLADDVPHTGFQQGPEVVHDYKGEMKSSLADTPQVKLKKFAERGLNERGLHTKIEFSLAGGQKIELPLYARRGFRHLLGFDGSSKKLYWTLVIPKEYQNSSDPKIAEFIKKVSNNKKSLKVHLEEDEAKIHIAPEFFSRNRFTLDFVK